MSISLSWLEIVVFVNCIFGAYLAARFLPNEDKNWKSILLNSGFTFIVVWFGPLIMLANIVWVLLEDLWIYLQLKAWFNLLRGKWDNMTEPEKLVFISRTPGILKNFPGAPTRLWVKTVAKRNNIEL